MHAAGRVALEETGAVLGDLLRRALAQRLARRAEAADGPVPEGAAAERPRRDVGLVLRGPTGSGTSG